jgi:selenocysteine lyase/cysteine desulfurase
MTQSSWRDLFDLPRDIAYFNAAQIGPMPRSAVAAGQAAFDAKARPWTETVPETFFNRPEALRGAAAALFNAAADDVALVPAASYGLATAARNLTVKEDSEILVLADQFPSNVYTWRTMAARDGATVRTVSRSANESWTDALLAAIGPQTGLVACGALNWIDGGRIDLEQIGAAARAVGAPLVLDLTQSLGVMTFDAQAVQPDFAVAAGYKWLLGPYTLGYLYVAPQHQSGAPLEENWINRERSEDFSRLIDYRDGYQPGARRFDMGERSNHQLVPPALEALRVLSKIGVNAAAAHIASINDALIDAARPFGLNADTPDRAGHYLSLALPSDAPADLAQRLDAHGVKVSQRGPRLRISPHIYSDAEDVARFAAGLKAALP